MIYLLQPKDDQSYPWKPWCDKCFGIVVCAPNEDRARIVATHEHDEHLRDGRNVWLDRKWTTCEALDPLEGCEWIVLSDVRES